MQFIILGYDGTDEGALERRLAVREAHLKVAREMYEGGQFLYASAILNPDGKMIGSMIISDFPSRDDLDRWLNQEPYVTGKVWQKIEIHRAQVAGFCAGDEGK